MFQYPDPEETGVLIIDDEPQIVEAVTDLLEGDFRVVSETSPQSALGILREDAGIAAIVCDQRMPRMTGDQFFTEAKKLSIATRVLITGYADLEVVVRAVNEGKIFAYVTKPWEPDHLMSTVRKAAEFFSINRALWRERSLLNDLMRSVPDGVFIKDRQGRFIRLNEAEAACLGLRSAVEAVGKTLGEILPDDQSERILEDERELLATGKPAYNRIRQIVSKGDTKWYAVNMAPIREPGSGIVGMVGVSRDVTEDKNIQRVKDEFISTISHELRTPLTSIQGSLALLRGGLAGDLPGRVAEFIEISFQNCTRLLRLINDILDVEKLAKGELQFDLKPVELSGLLEDAVAANAGYAQAEGKRIELARPVPDVRVNADRGRLLQVLANLISNAIKFSPSDAKVRLRASVVRGYVRVAIVDRGAGIQKEFRRRIFQRFSQADSSDTRKIGGTGLGLNISRSIVEHHGGRIDYRSHVNFGSKFYFELPIFVASAAGDAARA